jgi:hypothetical protein
MNRTSILTLVTLPLIVGCSSNDPATFEVTTPATPGNPKMPLQSCELPDTNSDCASWITEDREGLPRRILVLRLP